MKLLQLTGKEITLLGIVKAHGIDFNIIYTNDWLNTIIVEIDDNDFDKVITLLNSFYSCIE